MLISRRQQLLTLLCEKYDNAPNLVVGTHFTDGLFRHGDRFSLTSNDPVGQHLHIENESLPALAVPNLTQKWRCDFLPFVLVASAGKNETLFIGRR